MRASCITRCTATRRQPLTNLTSDDAPIVAGFQGLTVGVVNSFTTPYKLRCNIVVQTRCGGYGP